MCCWHLLYVLRALLEWDPLILPGCVNVPALCLVMNRARSDSSAPCSFHEVSWASIKGRATVNENRCFQESYLVAKNSPLTPSPPASSAPPCCPCIAAAVGRWKWTGWLVWQAACLAGHPVMDLFEWIKTGPWLYKYPQIMCPIIVFTSTKQRSPRWFIISTIGIFTPAGIEPGLMEWTLHTKEPWLNTLGGTTKHRTWFDAIHSSSFNGRNIWKDLYTTQKLNISIC